MDIPKPSAENKFLIKKWEKTSTPTQEEAEARLSQEGYESFCWYDVPGVFYPRHWHRCDECVWILRGEIHFIIDDQTYVLNEGDRIYMPALLPHQAKVPSARSVTFLVGKKNSLHD